MASSAQALVVLSNIIVYSRHPARLYYFPAPVVELPGVPIDATLPSSSLIFSVRLAKPNLSLPHTCCFLRPLRPSPNSLFHLRSAARLPRDSEEEGVISFNALSKCSEDSIRTCCSGSAVEASGEEGGSNLSGISGAG